MLKFVFCATFLFHVLTSGFYQNAWSDDIDGPEFLRGAVEQIQEDKELDSSNDLPSAMKRVASDEFVTTASSVKESMICQVAAHPDGIKTTRWNKNKPPIYANNGKSNCMPDPHPATVSLDRPAGVTYHPASVLLHRCVGYCVSQDLQNCTVKRQEEIVMAILVSEKGSATFKNITVYNHTECGCACMTRKSDCNEAIHNYDENKCKCECKKSHTSCNSAIKRWDDQSCDCKCIKAQTSCDQTSNHVWNEKICDCDCTKKVKDRCPRKGKVLNKATCGCDCPTPRPTCPQGEKFLKFNCTCVQDTSVLTK